MASLQSSDAERHRHLWFRKEPPWELEGSLAGSALWAASFGPPPLGRPLWAADEEAPLLPE